MDARDERSAGDLDDGELLTAISQAVRHERQATCLVIELLAEVDHRRLYLGEGYSSLFTYCTHVLHLSEQAAYGRIEAARCIRRVPGVLPLLHEGQLTLTTLGLLAPHLTLENAGALLEAASGKSKREVERLVAVVRPLPAVAAQMRRLPAAEPASRDGRLPDHSDPGALSMSSLDPGEAASAASADHASIDLSSRSCRSPLPDVRSPVTKQPGHLGRVTPLAPERYKVQFTASRGTHDLLRRAQDLLRHVIPNGDIAEIVERALTMLVKDLERMRWAATTRPRRPRLSNAAGRHVPAAVKRAVWQRDAGQCAFMGTLGRCAERGFLEIHHVVPFAAGGRTVVDNLELRCRAHNLHEAARYFGARVDHTLGETTVDDDGEVSRESVHEQR